MPPVIFSADPRGILGDLFVFCSRNSDEGAGVETFCDGWTAFGTTVYVPTPGDPSPFDHAQKGSPFLRGDKFHRSLSVVLSMSASSSSLLSCFSQMTNLLCRFYPCSLIGLSGKATWSCTALICTLTLPPLTYAQNRVLFPNVYYFFCKETSRCAERPSGAHRAACSSPRR